MHSEERKLFLVLMFSFLTVCCFFSFFMKTGDKKCNLLSELLGPCLIWLAVPSIYILWSNYSLKNPSTPPPRRTFCSGIAGLDWHACWTILLHPIPPLGSCAFPPCYITRINSNPAVGQVRIPGAIFSWIAYITPITCPCYHGLDLQPSSRVFVEDRFTSSFQTHGFCSSSSRDSGWTRRATVFSLTVHGPFNPFVPQTVWRLAERVLLLRQHQNGHQFPRPFPSRALGAGVLPSPLNRLTAAPGGQYIFGCRGPRCLSYANSRPFIISKLATSHGASSMVRSSCLWYQSMVYLFVNGAAAAEANARPSVGGLRLLVETMF